LPLSSLFSNMMSLGESHFVSVFLLNIFLLISLFIECCTAECHSSRCRYFERHGAMFTLMPTIRKLALIHTTSYDPLTTVFLDWDALSRKRSYLFKVKLFLTKHPFLKNDLTTIVRIFVNVLSHPVRKR
jgi:hypothetical protein